MRLANAVNTAAQPWYPPHRLRSDRDRAVIGSLSSVGDDFDLDFGVDHQLRLRRRPGGLVLGEEFCVDAVERPEVARVVQPYCGLDDVLQRASGERKRLFDVLQRLPRLRLDAARHDLAVVVHRDLPRHKHEWSGLDRRRERQRLAAGAGAGSSQEFDTHWILRWLAGVGPYCSVDRP